MATAKSAMTPKEHETEFALELGKSLANRINLMVRDAGVDPLSMYKDEKSDLKVSTYKLVGRTATLLAAVDEETAGAAIQATMDNLKLHRFFGSDFKRSDEGLRRFIDTMFEGLFAPDQRHDVDTVFDSRVMNGYERISSAGFDVSEKLNKLMNIEPQAPTPKARPK